MVAKSINKLKVSELKRELVSLGLSKTGTKKVLLNRLRNTLDSRTIEIEGETSPLSANKNGVDVTCPQKQLKRRQVTTRKVSPEITALQRQVDTLKNTIKHLMKSNKRLSSQVAALLSQQDNGVTVEASTQESNAETNIPLTTTPEEMFSASDTPSENNNTLTENTKVEVNIGSSTRQVCTSLNTSFNVRLPKMLLLGDSHGRNLGPILKDLCFKKFEILSIFKPNAKLGQIVEDIFKLTKHFTHEDVVIVLGGTNDFTDGRISKSILKKILFVSKYTNVIMNNVPYRYDSPGKNKFIYNFNKYLYNATENFKNCQRTQNIILNDINGFLIPKDYTQRGLHLNAGGKKKLGESIMVAIESLLISTPSVTNNITVSISDSEINNNIYTRYETPSAISPSDATDVSAVSMLEHEQVSADKTTFLHHPANTVQEI